MKTPVLLFLVIGAIVFAWQVVLDVVIVQITFGFANETLIWRIVSAGLVGLAVAFVSAFVRRRELASA